MSQYLAVRSSVAFLALTSAVGGCAASPLPQPASPAIAADAVTNTSTKVTIFGTENTGGFLDYGNLRRIDLPSGERRLFMPMTRSRRLPAMPLDAIGLAPDVRIPAGEADPLEFARRFLLTGRGAT